MLFRSPTDQEQRGRLYISPTIDTKEKYGCGWVSIPELVLRSRGHELKITASNSNRNPQKFYSRNIQLCARTIEHWGKGIPIPTAKVVNQKHGGMADKGYPQGLNSSRVVVFVMSTFKLLA